MNNQILRDQEPHPASSTSTSRSNSGPGRPPVISDTATDVWYYPPGPPAGEGRNFQQPNSQLPTPSGSTMIGPTSTFYSPEEYQQWLDVIESQSQHTQPVPQMPVTTSSYGTETVHGHNPQQNPSIFDFHQGHYPTTIQRPIDQYVASGANAIAQSNVRQVTAGPAFQNQGDIFRPFFDLGSITASSSSSPDQGQTYNASPSESTLQSFSTTPEHTYRQQPHSQPVFTNTNPQQSQIRPQVKRHPQSSRPVHQPRSLLPRPGRSAQQGSIRQSSSQFKQTSGQTRFALQPHQPHATSSQSNVSTSHFPASSGPQHSALWANDRQHSTPTSASPSAGVFYHVSATNVASFPKEGSASHQKDASTTQGSESSWSSEKTRRKRKRSRKEGTQESSTVSDADSDDDEFAGGISVGIGGIGKGELTGRLPGACTHCKRLKMKCDFPPDDNTCNRCKTGGHICIVEGRRPRTAPNKREYLLAQIRQKDAIIESLLKQLHNPYLATPLSIASYRMATSPSDQTNKNVLDWLDRLQSSVRDPVPSSKIARAFLDHRGEDDSDTESDGKRTLSQGNMNTGDKQADSDSETVQSVLSDSTVPIGLLANLSLSNKKKVGKKKDSGKDVAELLADELNDDNIGVANERYFMPGPATDLGIRASLIEQHSPPEILVHGLVKPEDVDKLFQIFYERINPFISLLDPVLHTPASTFTRCPFLFTVICAVCSRFYTEKSEIYPIAMHFAKHSAASALTDGWKSVELCQAYILMSIFAVPARRWEEDRSWLYTGLAIRIATDLNLHQISNVKPQSEKQEREILNRRRVWLICFNLDRSTATQFGKPSTIKEDYLVRNSREWYKKSQYNHPYDVHMCAYTALLRIVKKFHDEIFSDPGEPTGLNKNIDFKSVTLSYDAQLTAYHEEWSRRFQEDSDPRDSGCVFRCTLLPFLVAYSRLVMFSFGFQQAFRRGFRNNDPLFFNTCLDAAKTVVRTMIDILAPSGYMRFAPDGHFVFASFASAFLLKLLQPEFSSFLAKQQETEILDLIGRLIQTLSSPRIAIDDRHTPKLYARFLAGLLSRHRRDGSGPGRSQANPPPRQRVPAKAAQSQAAPAPATSVPPQPEPRSGGQDGQSQMPGNVAQATGTYTVPQQTSFEDIPFTLEDFDMGTLDVISEAEMLATMQAIKNPAWWSTGLMPGFSWPEGSPSPTSSSLSPSMPFQNANGTIPAAGFIPQWNAFQGTTVV